MYRSRLLPLLGACFILLLGTQPVLAQDMQCQEELSQANAMYTTGRFDAAIERVDACLAKESISDMERRTAYRLKGLCFIGKGAEVDAKSSVRRLLEIIPNYEPDPVQDPPDFVALVNEMKDEVTKDLSVPDEGAEGDVVQEQTDTDTPAQVEEPVSQPPPQPVTQVTKKKKRGNGRLLLIGAGVAVAGGAAILLAGGGGDGGGGGGNVIAEPPPLPN